MVASVRPATRFGNTATPCGCQDSPRPAAVFRCGLVFPQRVQGAAGRPVLAAGHEQFLGREPGEQLAAIGGDHDLLLDPGCGPAVGRGPVGLQREHHALFEHLGMIQRHQAAEDRLLPDRQPDAVAVLEGEGGHLVGKAELLRPRPQRDDVGGGGTRPDQRDGLVHVLAAADVGVALGAGRAGHREGAVVAGPVAQVTVQDVEEGRITGPDQPVGVHVRVRRAALAGDRVDPLHVLAAQVVEDLADQSEHSFSRTPGRRNSYSSV